MNIFEAEDIFPAFTEKFIQNIGFYEFEFENLRPHLLKIFELVDTCFDDVHSTKSRFYFIFLLMKILEEHQVEGEASAEVLSYEFKYILKGVVLALLMHYKQKFNYGRHKNHLLVIILEIQYMKNIQQDFK